MIGPIFRLALLKIVRERILDLLKAITTLEPDRAESVPPQPLSVASELPFEGPPRYPHLPDLIKVGPPPNTNRICPMRQRDANSSRPGVLGLVQKSCLPQEQVPPSRECTSEANLSDTVWRKETITARCD